MVATGIEVDDVRQQLGLVSEFEERDCAVQAGYTWKEWEATDVLDRAATVAFQRIKRLMALHADDALATDQELRTRRQEREKRRSAE